MTSKTITAIASSALIALASSAAAQTAGHSQTRPLDQAIESVDANLEKDPHNPGLNRGAEELRYNQARIERRQRDERPWKPERAQRPPRPEIPQRPLR